jgi:hypothetical protein
MLNFFSAVVPGSWEWRLRLLTAIGLVGVPAPAWAAFPKLTLVLPRGVERGGERELVFRGERLGDAAEVLLHPTEGGPRGLVVRSIEPIDEKSFRAVVHVPEDCPPGEQLAQVRTRSGMSEARSFLIGTLPVIEEKEPNDAPDSPQEVPMDITVHGTVTAEDLDCYAVEVPEGGRLSVEVEGLRLGSHRFDPLISVLGPDGNVLATVDDLAAALQDGFLSLVAEHGGRHVVQIREAAWGGDAESRYRLHIGGFPRPTAVYPAGGQVGTQVEVTFLGDASGPIVDMLDLPPEPIDRTTRIHLHGGDGGSISPTGLAFRLSSLGNTLEHEPNDDVATATAGAVATAFNGIIERPGDVDHFRFEVRQGQSLQVECHARRLGSGLDPVVAILAADGKQLAANDDVGGPDSGLRFDPPADGEYLLRVKDQLGRGQSDFVYRVEMLPIAPSLTLSIPRVDRYSQTRQTVFVPRGNRYAVLVNAARRNFDGDLELDHDGLPEGMTMTAPRIRAGQTQVPVIFEAAPDAPLGGRLVDLQARQVHDPERGPRQESTADVSGGFENALDLVLGNPNNAVHYAGQLRRLAMAVLEEVPLRVDLVPPRAPLVRKGRLDLEVVVTRGEGFSQPVTVEFPFRPPGVAAHPTITIPADATTATYQLDANDKAGIGDWTIFVLAAADIGGTAWVASSPVTLEVAEPFTEPVLVRASGVRGHTVPMACTLAQRRPFTGEATARLSGLPIGATAPDLRFTAETSELVFQVATTDATPLGHHKTVFVEIETPVDGSAVRLTGPASELQIVESSAGPAAAVPAAGRPLSRLQQLRQQHAATSHPSSPRSSEEGAP